jgi:hypothetical protein
MNNESLNINAQIPPGPPMEENEPQHANAAKIENLDQIDDNFSILETDLHEEQIEKSNKNSVDNTTPPAHVQNDKQKNENKENVSNLDDSNANSNEYYHNMNASMINFLKTIQEQSFQNDENSVKFFEENIPQTINSFLTTK